jgi:hypothetical protein
MAKAREAEALLMQEDGPRQALIAYEKLEKEVPNQPPLILRCAQLADQLDDMPVALFYYRRYLALTGERARQEAKDRAATLELSAEARQGADRLSRDRKMEAKPVNTPSVRSSAQVMVALGNDARSLMEVKDPEELARAVDPANRAQMTAKLAAATPQPTASTREDDALVRSFAARSGSQGTAAPIQPANTQGQAPSLSRVTVRQGQVQPRPTPAETMIQDQEPAATNNDFGSQPALAPLNPEPGNAYQNTDDAAPLDASSNAQVPLGYRAPQFQDGPATRPDNQARRSRSGAMVSDAGIDASIPPNNMAPVNQRNRNAPGMLQPNSAGEFSNVPPIETAIPANPPSSSPQMAAPLDPRQRFFVSRPSTDGKTRLKLSNNLPDTVMTFSALSESSDAKADAILATGENRTIEVSPAAFEVRLTIMSIGYPPATITDRRFRMRFNAGTDYTVRLSQDLLQRLN